MISVVIPAHNEEALVIGTLVTLLDGLGPRDEVIVVCNGCIDNTAKNAASLDDHRVVVIETDTASKNHALNLGDKRATGFPRFYVDADISVAGASLLRVGKELSCQHTNVLVAAPRISVDVDGRPWTVRAFYRIWMGLPYTCEALVGSGVYGISECGRSRFTAFPDITADDAFVRLSFSAKERRVVQGATFKIQTPRTLGDVIAIKTRSHFGNLELRERYPELWLNEAGGASVGLLRCFAKPWLWPSLLIYGYVKIVSRRRARARLRKKDFSTWERDESTRVAVES